MSGKPHKTMKQLRREEAELAVDERRWKLKERRGSST